MDSLMMKLAASSVNLSHDPLYLPFLRFLSLEQLAALKTSFIKTKFYPIYLRGAASQLFHDANRFPRKNSTYSVVYVGGLVMEISN